MTRVLLTGATGFVGAHLLPVLQARGFDVVAGSRRPDEATRRAPARRFCRFDLDDVASVDAAMKDVRAAIYLVHGMALSRDYAAVEARNARTFLEAAERAGLDRIVYLGGMRPAGKPSHHLASRLRTGEILRSGRVKTVELRATMILGGGSESFRIVRDLAARLPFMLLPKWLHSESEPVGIDDVAAAIVHALEMPLDHSRVLSLPGPERLSGRDVILRTAALLGQRPRVLDIPIVTPKLSSYWIRLVTRANPRVATELVEGLRSDIVSEGDEMWGEMPGYVRTPFEVAVRRALAEESRSLGGPTRAVERALHRLARG